MYLVPDLARQVFGRTYPGKFLDILDATCAFKKVKRKMRVENELKRFLNNLLEYNINKLVDFYKIKLDNGDTTKILTESKFLKNIYEELEKDGILARLF